MDAFFVIPAMVSPNVNERIIPALVKMIERNIVLENHNSIKLAIYKKYGTSRYTTESSKSLKSIKNKVMLKEGPKYNLPKSGGSSIIGGGVGDIVGAVTDVLGAQRPGTGPRDRDTPEPIAKGKDSLEYPRGIGMYHTVGLEPTYLMIPMEVKSGLFTGTASRMFLVGFKCVPYYVENIGSIVELLKDFRNISVIEGWFKKKVRNLIGRIPFTIPRQIRVHGARGGEAASAFSDEPKKYDIVQDIIYAPSSDTFSNYKALAKYMSGKTRTVWSTMIIFSNKDFNDMDPREVMKLYYHMSKNGLGDIIIVNEAKETASFCTRKMGACFELSFAYLRNQKIMDNNVLDYSEVSRWTTKPFHYTPLNKALMDNCNVLQDSIRNVSKKQLLEKLEAIILRINGNIYNNNMDSVEINKDPMEELIRTGYPFRPVVDGDSHLNSNIPITSKVVKDLSGRDDDEEDGGCCCGSMIRQLTKSPMG